MKCGLAPFHTAVWSGPIPYSSVVWPHSIQQCGYLMQWLQLCKKQPCLNDFPSAYEATATIPCQLLPLNYEQMLHVDWGKLNVACNLHVQAYKAFHTSCKHNS